MKNLFDYLQRHRLARLVVCLAFCFLTMFAFSAPPVVTAYAAATISIGGIIAVISTLLLSLGITFSSPAERDKVSLSFYNGTSAPVREWVNGQVLQFPTPPSGNDDRDPEKSGLLGAVLNVPATVMTAFVVGAASFFGKGNSEIKDISGIYDFPWQAYVSKPLSAIPNFSNDHSSYGHLPIPILINSIPTGSPYAGDTIIPISPSAVVPFNTVVPSATHNFSLVSSTQVCRIVGVSGTTYDFRAHVALTSSGVVTSLSVNNNYLSSIRNSYDGLAQIKDLMVSFGWKSNLVADFSIPCLSVRFDYLKGELWEAGGNRYYGYAPSMQLHDTKFSPASVFGGYVDGRTGTVKPPTVSYNPSILSNNPEVIQQALKDYFANPDNLTINVQVPSTGDGLTNSQWQQLLNAQLDYVNNLELLLEQLASKPPVIEPAPDISIGNAGTSTITGVTGQVDALGDMYDGFFPSFDVAVGAIDPSTAVVPPSFARSIFWVNEQFMKSYNKLGDYKFIIVYPMFIGISMLVIGRGGQALASTEIRRRRNSGKSTANTSTSATVPISKE